MTHEEYKIDAPHKKINALFTAIPIKKHPELKSIMRKVIEEKAKVWAKERLCEEEIVRYMLRHQVKPVIKGEITKGKIKWRGLSIARFYKDNTFLGLVQRGKFIEPDWVRIKLSVQLNEAFLVGISNLHKKSADALKYFSGGIFEQIKNNKKEEHDEKNP